MGHLGLLFIGLGENGWLLLLERLLKRFVHGFGDVFIQQILGHVNLMGFLIWVVLVVRSVDLSIYFLYHHLLLILYHWLGDNLGWVRLVANRLSKHLKVVLVDNQPFLLVFIEVINYWYTHLALKVVGEVKHMHLPELNRMVCFSIRVNLWLGDARYCINLRLFANSLKGWGHPLMIYDRRIDLYFSEWSEYAGIWACRRGIDLSWHCQRGGEYIIGGWMNRWLLAVVGIPFVLDLRLLGADLLWVVFQERHCLLLLLLYSYNYWSLGLFIHIIWLRINI